MTGILVYSCIYVYVIAMPIFISKICIICIFRYNCFKKVPMHQIHKTTTHIAIFCANNIQIYVCALGSLYTINYIQVSIRKFENNKFITFGQRQNMLKYKLCVYINIRQVHVIYREMRCL